MTKENKHSFYHALFATTLLSLFLGFLTLQMKDEGAKDFLSKVTFVGILQVFFALHSLMIHLFYGVYMQKKREESLEFYQKIYLKVCGITTSIAVGIVLVCASFEREFLFLTGVAILVNIVLLFSSYSYQLRKAQNIGFSPLDHFVRLALIFSFLLMTSLFSGYSVVLFVSILAIGSLRNFFEIKRA